MPSIGTSILSARVKDETIKAFKETAEVFNTTVPKILDSVAGVTHDDSGALSAFFIGILMKKGYTFEEAEDILNHG